MANIKTEEELNRFIEANHNLIYSFLRNYRLDDEYYGDAAIGLCKAARSFDDSKGTRFSTYAYKCMLNECGQTMRVENRISRLPTISLELTSEDARGQDISLENILSAGNNTQEYANTLVHFQWFIDGLDFVGLQIILLKIQDNSCEKIANKLGMTGATVRNRIHSIAKLYSANKRPCCKISPDDKPKCAELKSHIVCSLRYILDKTAASISA